MLQFITNSSTTSGTIKQALEAIAGGCRWIQVRMKDSSVEDISGVLDELGPICQQLNVILIVDDHVSLALRDDVSGVHLGQMDVPVAEARKILGHEKIIGLTINTINQAKKAKGVSADYYGVGPWRFTTTKSLLAPILGAEGVKDLVSVLKENNPISPIVIIGGITVDDVEAVMETGADGVAVSSAISEAKDPAGRTADFLKRLNKKLK